jgi:hypothetical protein
MVSMHVAVSMKRNIMQSMGSSGTGVCAAIVDDKVRSLTQLARIPRDFVSMKFLHGCVLAVLSSTALLLIPRLSNAASPSGGHRCEPSLKNNSRPIRETGKCCASCTYVECAGCNFYGMATQNLCVQKVKALPCRKRKRPHEKNRCSS